MHSTQQPPTLPSSRVKFILFSITPAALLVLGAVALEGALRLFAPSLAPPLFRETMIDGKSVVQVNRRYLERFFPWEAAMVPELSPSEFTPGKDSTVFRLVCLGGSSMFGTPYAVSATPASLLRKQLTRLMPGRTIEVINLGASAINTNVIVGMIPEILPLKPDLVVVYAGHNEFYGPGGVGAPWPVQRLPGLRPLSRFIRDLRITALVRSLIPSQRVSPGDERNMMKLASQGAEVSLSSDESRFVFSQFEANLREILGRLRDARVPVLVSDLTSNLDFPPLGAHPSQRQFEADRLLDSGERDSARQLLGSLPPGDASDAYAAYLRGRIALLDGDESRAYAALESARDLDPLKFRAPAETNRIIHRVCNDFAIPCLAADSVFRMASPSGITDTSLFTEHLHPNVRGYDLLVRVFLEGAQRAGLVPSAPLLPFDRDSLAICWLDLAVAELSLRHLTGGWPFEGFRAATPLLDGADSTRYAIVTAIAARYEGWHEAERKFAHYVLVTGDTAEAIRTYRTIAGDSPRDLQSLFSLAQLYTKTGSEERARSCYRLLLLQDSTFVPALVESGLLETNAGIFADARRHFARALGLTSTGQTAYLRGLALYGLGAVDANEGNYPRAAEHLQESVTLIPDFRPARELALNVGRRLDKSAGSRRPR
jgi:lysophospholipase L1-like esterase